MPLPTPSRRSTLRRVCLLLFTAAVLTACADPAAVGTQPDASPSPVASPSASASPNATPSCSPAGTLITLGEVDAALGLRALPVYLRNCGDQPYTVEGYPALRLLDDGGRPLDVTVHQGTDAVHRIDAVAGPPQRLAVAPGDRVVAVLVWRNTVADVTVPVTGDQLEVAPAPGEPAQLVVPNGGIDVGTTGEVAVSAWTAPPPEG